MRRPLPDQQGAELVDRTADVLRKKEKGAYRSGSRTFVSEPDGQRSSELDADGRRRPYRRGFSQCEASIEKQKGVCVFNGNIFNRSRDLVRRRLLLRQVLREGLRA